MHVHVDKANVYTKIELKFNKFTNGFSATCIQNTTDAFDIGIGIQEKKMILAGILVLAHVPVALMGCTSWRCVLRGPELNIVDNKASQTDTVTNTATGILICSQGMCGKLSYTTLEDFFPNTFFTIDEYTVQTRLKYHTEIDKIPDHCFKEQEENQLDIGTNQGTSRICNSLPPGDGDHCCSTHRYATYYMHPKFLDNTMGQKCVIVHLPASYQMVTEGICGPLGLCNEVKSCQQQYTVQSLLAWNTASHKLRFEMFDIPTYCSCVNGS